MEQRPRAEFGTDLVHLALNDPVAAVRLANEVLSGDGTEAEAVVALRARGLAQRQLGDIEASAADLTTALARAEALGDDELWAGAGLSLAGTFVFQGRVEEAKRMLEQCIKRSNGESHVHAIYQLGTTYAQAGELDAAVGHYARALPLIRQLDRPTWEGDLLGNRGVMNIYRGQYDEAITDLDAAIKLHAKQGPSLYSLHRGNKAYALQLSGDLTAAIDLYEDNERFQAEHELPTLMYSQRCTAYLAAGMFEEAMLLAQRAHRFHSDGKATLGAIEALLPGAEAALALGNTKLATQLAEAAIALDAQGGFPALTARARLATIESRLQSGTSESNDVATARQLSATVSESDATVAVRSLLVGSAVALEHQDPATAAELLDEAGGLVAQTPLHVQIERCALLARTTEAEDVVGAVVDDGLAAFDELVSGNVAYDVHYKAARHAEQLLERGIEAFLRGDRLESALAMIERVRAGSVLLNNRVVEEGSDELHDGESYLVWVERHDEVFAIAMTGDETLKGDGVPRAEVEAAAERHRFAHRQLARRAGLSEASRDELLAAAESADTRLASLLIPTGLGRRVILNPSRTLDRILWGSLPGLAERSIAVSPSLAVARRKLPATISEVVVLGASELPHVPDEVQAVSRVWDASSFLNPDVTVLEQLAGADLFHAAGHFVADGANPLFSALPLGELRLRGHEYLQLQPPPAIAVLSACASGQGEVVAGAQVGFSSAALAAGTASVIVTQTVIEDGPTIVRVMTELHQALKRGEAPADALRDARSNAVREDRSAVAALGVVGAGW